MSNFPAWTLDDARSSEHTIIPTFGFRIVDDPEQEPTAWPPSDRAPFAQVLKRLVNTAMWGRGDLESRRIDDLHPMEVRTRVKATDFHRIREVRGELYRSGRARVEEYFRERLGPRDPQEMEGRLRSLKALVKAILNGRGTVRAYVLQRVDDRQARVVYSAVYERDADEALAFRLDAACQTMCLALREPLLIRTGLIGDDQRRAPATKSIHALRPASVTHIYCIPMFRLRDEWTKADPMLRSVPDEALCFDFTDLRDGLLLDPEIEDAFAAMSAALVDLWLDCGEHELPRRSSVADQMPASDWTATGSYEGFFVSDRKLRFAPAIDIQSQIDRATR